MKDWRPTQSQVRVIRCVNAEIDNYWDMREETGNIHLEKTLDALVSKGILESYIMQEEDHQSNMIYKFEYWTFTQKGYELCQQKRLIE